MSDLGSDRWFYFVYPWLATEASQDGYAEIKNNKDNKDLEKIGSKDQNPKVLVW